MRLWLLLAALLATVGATVADLNEAGKAAYARGDYAEAERLFREAVTRAPDDPLLHYHRGAALTRLGRWRDAAAAYEAALRLGPPEPLKAHIREGLRELQPVLRPPPRRPPAAAATWVPLMAIRSGVWLVEVTLNDSRRARFLLDTGATFCGLSKDLADALGIGPGRASRQVRLNTGAGPITAPLVSVPSIRVGDVEVEDVPTVIIDMHTTAFEGILGNSFLAHFSVTVDPDRPALALNRRY
jgi:clan AA aspartic protease (TIGR02281 family)